MKRTVLAVLMAVMIATPCLAQEIETDGLFSIEGTRWGSCGISASLQLGWDGSGSGFNCNIGCFRNSYGFYEGKVYSCGFDYSFPEENSFYIDTPLVSIAYIFPNRDLLDVDLFIMQPSGFGVYTRLKGYFRRSYFFPDISYNGWVTTFGMGIMFKVEDGWTPNPPMPEFGFISPNQGQQGTTLTNVTITGINTSFQDDPPVDIAFIPPDGLTVSSISTISNTGIEFVLEIDTDAYLGSKTVVVVYDDGMKSIVGNNVFVALERIN